MSEINPQMSAVALALERAKNIVTVSHRRPDGDTVGAAIALSAALESLGKNVSRFCVDAPPDNLRTFMGGREFTADPAVLAVADVIVVLDASDLRYVAIEPYLSAMAKRPLLVNVDHHAVNERFGDINLVVPTAASTTEIVFGLIKAIGAPVTPEAATAILIGIVTDTMMFFNPATTASSLQVAAELERLGGDMRKVNRLISKNRTVDSLVLWGRALERLKWDPEKSRVSTAIMAGDMVSIPPGDDAVDGLSNFLNNNLPARTILVLRELGDGLVKGSLRTASEGLDVSEEALRYGGGGHCKAAGYAVKGRIVEGETEWRVETDQ